MKYYDFDSDFMTDTSRMIYCKLFNTEENKLISYFFGYPKCVFEDLWLYLDRDWMKETLKEVGVGVDKKNEVFDKFIDQLTMFDVMENIEEDLSLEIVNAKDVYNALKEGSNVIFSNISGKWEYKPFGDKRSVDCTQFEDIMDGRPFISHLHNMNEWLVSVEKEYEFKKADSDAKFVAKTLDWHYVESSEVSSRYGKHSTENAVYVELFVLGKHGHYSKCRFFCPRKYAHFGRNGTVYIPYWIAKNNGSKEENVLSVY